MAVKLVYVRTATTATRCAVGICTTTMIIAYVTIRAEISECGVLTELDATRSQRRSTERRSTERRDS